MDKCNLKKKYFSKDCKQDKEKLNLDKEQEAGRVLNRKDWL